MIKFKGIEKRFENFLLKPRDCSFKEGEFISLLGQSGSGKSTLLNIIAGLDEDFKGTVLIDEDSPKEAIKKGHISMVFQEDLLFPHLNIYENIAFALKIRKVDKNIIQEKVMDILEKLQLTEKKNCFPKELSGGEKQRVSLGRALITNPKVLLMDEPFSALDFNLRKDMQSLIKSIHKNLKITIIFVTHDRDEAFYLSDKIGILYKGELLDFASPKEIYFLSKNFYTAKLLGVENILEKKIFKKIFGKNIPKGKYIGVRASDLKLHSDEGIKGVIKNIEFKMGHYLYEIEISKEVLYVMEKDDKYRLNSDIYLNLNDKNLLIIEE